MAPYGDPCVGNVTSPPPGSDFCPPDGAASVTGVWPSLHKPSPGDYDFFPAECSDTLSPNCSVDMAAALLQDDRVVVMKIMDILTV